MAVLIMAKWRDYSMISENIRKNFKIVSKVICGGLITRLLELR